MQIKTRAMGYRRWVALLALLVTAALPFGCGGGGTTGSADTGSGEVLIGLTDAPGDFLRYEVDVLSIQLRKANGTMVETLPLATRVDFAQLTELTEFVTAATVPLGRYTAATMVLDYGTATIEVEGADGTALVADTVDEDGNPLGELQVTVELDTHRALPIAPGIPAHLTLDFDLDATNLVDLSGPTPVVTVKPLLLAEVNPERPKVHRVRGPLLDVDTAAGTFDLAIRPAHVRNRHFGQLQVGVDGDTTYEIDGVVLQGADGLAALDRMPSGTAVVAVGDVTPGQGRHRHHFRASEVYAGSSVVGGTLDALSGTVLGREGNTLRVFGAVLDRNGAVTARAEFTVTVDEATTVTKQGAVEERTAADISVGQHLTAFGTYAPEDMRLDARDGHVRLLLTPLTGWVLDRRLPDDGQPGALDLVLQSLDGRRPQQFDFTGTGGTGGDDANPDGYTLDTGAMQLATIAVNDSVRAFGFVGAFGTAPPDFEARTVVDLSATTAHLRVRWVAANPAAVTAEPGTEALLLDLTGTGAVHHVGQAGVFTELVTEPPPRLLPAEDHGVYALRSRGPVRIYGSFADFAAALADQVEQGAQVTYLSATGGFDAESQTFTADRVSAQLR